ncbi:MAG TPA: tail fiber protein [Rhizomicrobium sp.]|nr:tail fiber protein [Rhizomicrobium sp.]
MAQPYIGEIRMFAGNFAPAGWAFCAGQILPISENDTLFNLIGTTYGGDGQSTFALPDLRGRAPMHVGNGTVLAQTGGSESVTLSTQQIPSHQHLVMATTGGQALTPLNNSLAVPSGGVQGIMTYAAGSPNTPLVSTSVLNAGGSQPHDNMQPYLCVSFIIALYGVYPTPT